VTPRRRSGGKGGVTEHTIGSLAHSHSSRSRTLPAHLSLVPHCRGCRYRTRLAYRTKRLAGVALEPAQSIREKTGPASGGSSSARVFVATTSSADGEQKVQALLAHAPRTMGFCAANLTRPTQLKPCAPGRTGRAKLG
jgi:hypothetical protein